MRRAWLVLVTMVVSVVSSVDPVADAAPASGTAPARVVTRHYGGPPVRDLVAGQTLYLRFRGHEGDRVRLAPMYEPDVRTFYRAIDPGAGDDVRLLDRSGIDTDVAPDPAGFYVLPRSGAFMFRYRMLHTPEAVQLLVRKVATYTRGTPLILPQLRGYQYAVRVRAPRRLSSVTFGTQVWGLTRGGRYWRNYHAYYFGHSLLLGAGFPAVGGMKMLKKDALEAGERLLVVLDPGAAVHVETHPVRTTSLSLDGARVDVPTDDRFSLAATFQGKSGQLVDLQRFGTDLDQFHRRRIVMFGPGHGYIRSGDAWFPTIYRLPSTGTYTVVTIPTETDDVHLELQLRSFVDLGDIEVDGAPVVVDAPQDGRKALAHMVADPTLQGWLHLSATDDTMSSDQWWAAAGKLWIDCRGNSSLGCGEQTRGGVTRSQPESGPFVSMDVLVVDTAGGTGSVTLRLTSSPFGKGGP